MIKIIFKRTLAALMTAVLILTSSGVISIASAAEKIKVESVFTNFQKASLIIGDTKQITTYTQPENASNRKMTFTSSNKKVATVSKTGLVTAISSGSAKITVKSKDGSGEYETVKITVLQNLTIKKKNVNSVNEVNVADKTFGNVTITDSVESALIYFKNIKIIGTLTLQGGDSYKVNLNNTSVNKAIIDKAQTNDKIVSMAVDTSNLKGPELTVANHSNVNDISTYIDALIRQEESATINTVNVSQKYSDALDAVMEGYTGLLNINAPVNGHINTQFVNSALSDTVITGGTLSSVNMGTKDNSTAKNITVNQQVNLDLGVPTDNIHVAKDAKGVALTVSSPVTTLTNDGTDSRVTISSNVNNILSTGTNGNISVTQNGTVSNATLEGASSTVSGDGKVTTINVNADNCSINTKNTVVNVGNVKGTLVKGAPQSANTGITTKPDIVVAAGSSSSSSSSGGGGGLNNGGTIPIINPTTTSAPTTSAPTTTAAAPTTATPTTTSTTTTAPTPIVKADFENGTMDGLTGTLGTGLTIVDGGYNSSSKCLQVTTASISWGTPGFDLLSLAGKTVTVIAYMKNPDAVGQKVGFSLQLESASVTGTSYTGASADASSGWTRFEYTWDLPSDATRAYLYFEKSYQQTVPNFFLDRVMIYVGTQAEADAVYANLFTPSSTTPTAAATPTAIPTATPTAIPTATAIPTTALSLKNAYSSYFRIGVAVSDTVINTPADTALVKEQYNSITAENAMKPDSLLNQSGSQTSTNGMPVINTSRLNTYLGYAQANSLKVRGHVLVWHSQTPTWFFRVGYTNTGAYVTPAVMLQRMESYIKQVLQYTQANYPGVIYAWDVVNEAVTGDNGSLRTDNNEWYNVFGDFSYIPAAFQYARQYADSSVKLFYNDYNCYLKPNGIISVLAPIKAAGNIDGIGMQSHLSATFPSVSSIGATMDKFIAAGYEIQITELDIVIDSPSEVALQEAKYQDLFNLFISKAGHITSVTFWGLTDGLSWLSSKYPLLFNADLSKKESYNKVMAALTD